MKCPKVRNEIKAYIDGELRPLARLLVARHVARCEGCRKELVEMSELTAEVKNATEVTPPNGLRESVLQRLDPRPQPVRRRVAWPYKTSPIAFAGVMLVTVVIAAVLFPMFARSRGGEVMLAQSPNVAAPANVDTNAKRAWEPFTPIAPKVAELPPPLPRRTEALRPVGAVARKAKSSPEPTYDVGGEESSRPAATPVTAPNLLIIKTADVKLQVRDFQPAYDDAVSVARSVGGYVTDSSAKTTGGSLTSGRLTMRVPVDAFERVVTRLGSLGKVLAKSISGEDVTGEVVDLESRIRNKRAEERQYLDLMNRTKRITDIMAVSNELYRVRGEIEESIGRLKYLKSAAAMSTINIEMAEKEKPKPGKSSLNRAWDDAIGSLTGTGRAIASLLIWFAVYSPFWALPIAAWLLLKRREARTQS